jgi:acetylornithine deacetylase/succinyl-diaminopimelate desuccinylase-like protein
MILAQLRRDCVSFVLVAWVSSALSASFAQGKLGTATPRLVGASAVLPALDFSQFKTNIEILASFGDRGAGSPSYDAAESWIQSQLEAWGYVVEFHEYAVSQLPRRNMYATKVGSRPAGMYIVSAHLDGRGNGGAADDDASGCSLVLEAARAFAQPGVDTRDSVRFIFWNNEEFPLPGTQGSGQYVSDRQALQGWRAHLVRGSIPNPGGWVSSSTT